MKGIANQMRINISWYANQCPHELAVNPLQHCIVRYMAIDAFAYQAIILAWPDQAVPAN